MKEQDGLETVPDRLWGKLWRSRPYECQRDGINPQVAADVVFAERLQKPGGEELHGWNRVCHVGR